MTQIAERASDLPGQGYRPAETEADEAHSQSVILAVPGEFYSYASEFTTDEPLYALLKCKANKARPVADIGGLGREANLLFLFGSPHHVQVCSMRTAHVFGLLGNSVDPNSFGETWIARIGIADGDFDGIRSRRDAGTLAGICRTACSTRDTTEVLESETIVAMMTDGGKYGIFRVREITPASIQIDACHILLLPR